MIAQYTLQYICATDDLHDESLPSLFTAAMTTVGVSTRDAPGFCQTRRTPSYVGHTAEE
jgi:hypothetical protein